MSGLTELLIIVAIILAIILFPGRLRNQSQPETTPLNLVRRLTGWKRMAILASFLWLTLVALYLRPWNNKWYIFIYVGFGPVLLSWGIFWIFLGFKKKGR
jgi:hypothetical protein